VLLAFGLVEAFLCQRFLYLLQLGMQLLELLLQLADLVAQRCQLLALDRRLLPLPALVNFALVLALISTDSDCRPSGRRARTPAGVFLHPALIVMQIALELLEAAVVDRSEERRVGKEWRSKWWTE